MFVVKHWFIPVTGDLPENQAMLEPKDLPKKQRLALAARIQEAIETADPKTSKAKIAGEFEVTPQAVTGWTKTGRITKANLARLAERTGLDIDFFFGDGDRSTFVQSKGRMPSDASPRAPRATHEVLRHNIQALLKRRSRSNMKKRLATLGIDIDAVQRSIADGNLEVGILEPLSAAFLLQPYQLLIPDLNVRRPQIAVAWEVAEARTE